MTAMLCKRRVLLLFLLLLGSAALARSQEKSVKPGINDPFKDPDLKKYLNTFEGESRELFTQREAIVAACDLKAGMTIGDIGSGTGLFTRLFADRVGPQGKVFAVDISPKFLDHVTRTAKAAGLTNVHPVLCTQTSPELPPNSVDLLFICDTYHHFEFPFRTVPALHRALKPGGKLVLIDFHRIPGKSSDFVMGHVRAGQEVFLKEITSCGFEIVDEKKILKENYFVTLVKKEVSQTPPTSTAFTYKRTPQGELQMHVHFPEGWKSTDRRPGAVFFFGGGWTNGKVEQFEPQARALAARGMVVARADYRVQSRHKVTPYECVEDARSAVRWLRRNAVLLGLDTERLVSGGGSAGGHLAACTALGEGPDAPDEDLKISSKPQVLLLYNPVLNFSGTPNLEQRLSGDAKKIRQLSPTLHLTRETPPTLLLYGTTDPLRKQGDEYLARAKEVGQRTELFLAEDVGHGFFNRAPWQERTTQRALEFLESLGYLERRSPKN